MINILEWVVWSILALLCIDFARGCYVYWRTRGVQRNSIYITIYFWILAFIFLVRPYNKLHILWAAPVGAVLVAILGNTIMFYRHFGGGFFNLLSSLGASIKGLGIIFNPSKRKEYKRLFDEEKNDSQTLSE